MLIPSVIITQNYAIVAIFDQYNVQVYLYQFTSRFIVMIPCIHRLYAFSLVLAFIKLQLQMLF